jgi:plasmid stabilization system protein ParE
MNIEFHPEAAEEFEAAVDWYEERETGLGLDFAVEIHAAIQRAAAMPDACTGRDALATRARLLDDAPE